MSRANVHYDLGSCRISIPNIEPSVFTADNTLGWTRLSTIPNGATKFNFTITAYGHSYLHYVCNRCSADGIEIPSSGSTKILYLSPNFSGIAISYGIYTTKKTYQVVYWVFRNNSGCLEISAGARNSDLSDSIGYIILLPISISGGFVGSLAVEFH